MTIGLQTLQLAATLVVEKRLEAERPRRWKIQPAAGISARGTPGRERSTERRSLAGRQPRQA